MTIDRRDRLRGDKAGGRSVTFLLDVDNTLLDNDRLKAYYARAIEGLVGAARAARFWALYEAVRAVNGIVDYPATIARFRDELGDDRVTDDVERVVYEAPFSTYLFSDALEVIAWLRTFATAVILSDGDPVYQPLKIDRSGIARAARGAVVVYPHKEAHLADVISRYPGTHYTHVDDKAALLAATKRALDGRATTVHVRQGHYADDPADDPRPDIVLDRIGDLRTLPVNRLGG